MTSTFPGDSTPARRTDRDHRLPWPLGPTDEANLHNITRRWHRAEQGNWRTRLLDDGTIVWISPHNGVYHRKPNRTLPPTIPDGTPCHPSTTTADARTASDLGAVSTTRDDHRNLHYLPSRPQQEINNLWRTRPAIKGVGGARCTGLGGRIDGSLRRWIRSGRRPFDGCTGRCGDDCRRGWRLHARLPVHRH